MSCNKVRANIKANIKKQQRKEAANARKAGRGLNSMFLAGPGSALKWIFIRRYRTTGCGGCHTTAKEMDKIGPDAVLDRVTEFAGKIHENAKTQKFIKLLDFIDYGLFGLRHYEDLIREAVQLHKDEIAKSVPQRRG